MSNLIKLMQGAEVSQSLPTKREIQASSKDFVKKLLDSGEYNKQELYAQALRLKEALTVIEKELKDSFDMEGFEAFGLKATYRSGGNTINYREDPVYEQMEKDLKDRQELLKLAQHQELVLDAGGYEVPKVSTTPRKSSLAVTF